MKITKYLIILLLFPVAAFSQNITEDKSNIALNIGWTKVFLTDEFISPNEYDGNSLIYGIHWGDVNSKRIVQIDVSFNKIDNLSNNLSEATNSIFSLIYSHTFFISESKILNKQFGLYLGPGLSLYFSDRKQKYIDMKSQIGFGSVDINANAFLQLTEKISISSQLLLSVVMFANKDQNQQNRNDDSNSKILSVFSFRNLMFDIIFNYEITTFLFTKAAYRFSFMQTDSWDYYRMIADKIYLQLGVSF